MPALKIGLNLDTRRVISSTGSSLQAFSAKRGSVIDFELAVTQGSIPVSLPQNSTVEFAMKLPQSDEGTYVYHADAARSGWGTGSRWFFRVDLSGPAFDSVAVLGKALDTEILISMPDDGQRIASLTISFTILRNVIP